MNHFLDDKLDAASSIWKYDSTQPRCLVLLSIHVNIFLKHRTYSLEVGNGPMVYNPEDEEE
jgi:hypothetical protein